MQSSYNTLWKISVKHCLSAPKLNDLPISYATDKYIEACDALFKSFPNS